MAYSYRNVEPAAVDSPKACPACRSEQIVTTSKTVSTASYWRCTACGEIWNAGRRQTPAPRRTWQR
jgi:transposase-like protein